MTPEVFEGDVTGYKTWKLDGVVQGIIVSIRLDMGETQNFHHLFPEGEGRIGCMPSHETKSTGTGS